MISRISLKRLMYASAMAASVVFHVAWAMADDVVKADIATSAKLGESTTALESEIASLHEKFWSSFADRNLWAIGEMWDKADPSVSAIFPASGNPAVSWGNVAENFRQAFSHNRDIKIETSIVHVYRQDDFVWLIATVRFSATQTQTGQPVMIDRILATEIYHRSGGRWLMVHYHGHNPAFIIPPIGPENLTVNAVLPKRKPSSVWAAYDKFQDAFQNRNLAGMFQIFDPSGDVAAIQPKSPVPFLGTENVMASWKKTFDDIQAITCDPQVLELNENGSVAWITDMSQYHIVFKDNPNEVIHFHNVMTTFIFTKHEGEWHLAYYHAHLGYSYEHQD